MDLGHEKRLQYDARLYYRMPQAGAHNSFAERGYYLLVITLFLLAPFLLYTKGGQLIKRLQQSRSKAKVPFFWAVASLAHVFNVYMILRLSSHCVHTSMHSQQVHFISNSKNMEFCYKLL